LLDAPPPAALISALVDGMLGRLVPRRLNVSDIDLIYV
jgi:hypothetical protein